MTDKTKAAMPGRLSLNALLKHRQITRLAAGGQTLSQRNPYVQINRVRLTYGHRNPLKLFQTVNLQSAQNSLKLLSQLNYREMRELANTLIIPKNTNGAVRLPQIEVLEEINNLVPESHLVHGSSTIGGWGSEAFLYHEENHNIAVLHRNPDLAYERVVPQSHEVNQLSLSKSDSLPTIRGLVNYKIFVVQRLCGTQRPAQNNPEIIGAAHSITGSNHVQLSDSDLAFLRCSDLSLRPQASRTQAEKFAFGFSSLSLSMQASIASTKSYGNRIPLYADLLFLCPVAIGKSRYWCFNTSEHTGGSHNTKVFKHKQLDGCDVVDLKCLNTLSTGKAQEVSNAAKPRGALTPSGLLTTSVISSNEAAMKDHITHPQGRKSYIWRFLALSAIGRNVIHITATTEREAREQSPAGCVMVFAGRLPVREVRYA
ncbi:host cell division inhibitor Icd-like protein [Klebsiella pneumoniae]|uniref:host cell division inhibitor Icd-like protein n=1 Tax=Klebsiella pneumoniae TaxID=573 RepID=UPI003F76F86A